MTYELFISIVLIIVGILYTFFNEKITKLEDKPQKRKKWELSVEEQRARMKIVGIGCLFIGSLYLLIQLFKLLF